ncbi:MAG: hypothetical protein RTU92_08325 [Candidatus Thorarchaeota archaeon]
MSSVKSAGLIMFLVIIITILPIGIVLFVFEMVGIMEYVGAYLWPIFMGSIFMILFTGFIIAAAVVLTRRQATSQIHASGQPVFSHPPEVSSSRDAYFVVPTRCPSCQEAIELDRVSWSDSQTMSCPNCLSSIHIRIRET